MPPLFRRLERTWYMVSNVPARQLLRRGRLVAMRHLERVVRPNLEAGEKPSPSVDPPRSALPPRADQVATVDGGLMLVMPWQRCRLWPEPPWHMAAPDEGKHYLRAALHNMEFLGAVDDTVALRLMRSWQRENPFDSRDCRAYAWRPFNLSLRVVAWMRELAARGSRLPADEVRLLEASLVAQLRYLARRLETDLRGNHLLKNITALLWGGAYFAGEEARAWYRAGEALLSEELDEQILADGVHHERSPSYQCQAMADLLDCRQALAAGPLRDRVEEALSRMARALRCLLHPDGDVALFNDGGIHASWPPAAVLAGWRAIGGRDPGALQGAFALPQAGYWGFSRNGDYLIVDCGPLGPAYLVGHGHADMLSFEWSSAGRRIVVDQGTYGYAAGPLRERSRSTRSHNTLTIGDAEQSDVYGAFRCGRRAEAKLLEWAIDGDGIRFRGTHDGFSDLPGRPSHEREIIARPGRIEIHDRLGGCGSRSGAARYLLHPGCRIVEQRADRLLLRREDLLVEVEASRPLLVQPAEWFPDLFTSVATRRLVCDVPPGEPGTRVVFRSRRIATA